jgi:hypothetical protein
MQLAIEKECFVLPPAWTRRSTGAAHADEHQQLEAGVGLEGKELPGGSEEGNGQ